MGGWAYWRRQLTHTGKGCSSIFDIILWIIPNPCRVDIGPKSVKKEGITNFKNDIHCASKDHNKDKDKSYGYGKMVVRVRKKDGVIVIDLLIH